MWWQLCHVLALPPFTGGAGARATIDQAQLERELELDIEKMRMEDNIDPNVSPWKL